MLASAGDDGNVLLWVPSELQTHGTLGEDQSDDKETWRVKHMCRSSGAEIYDLAWSPDGVFLITGSMDNVARIYNAQTGKFGGNANVRPIYLTGSLMSRSNDSPNRGTLALRTRCCLGPFERICCDAVL